MTPPITEQDWAELESERPKRGLARLRLYPRSGRDIHIAVVHPGRRRTLLIQADHSSAKRTLGQVRTLPRTRGLEIRFQRTEDRTNLLITLMADELRPVFNVLASDIAAAVSVAEDDTAGLLTAVRRFEHWRNLLQAVSQDGLGPDARRGLYGELWLLRGYILPYAGAAEAIEAWRGPTGANQDFQLPCVAVEVKTTAAKQPQNLVISNERELDGRGVQHLILAHVSVDERRGGTGESLLAIVEEIREQLLGTGSIDLFNQLLLQAGLLSHQEDLYQEPRYSVRAHHFWNVLEDFPRIVETDLRPGVGSCRYEIATAALAPYMTSDEVFVRLLRGEHRES